jgi:hypothetical protein
VQTCLDQRMIKRCVLFPTGHKGERGQVGEHCSSAILPIEPQQGALRWKLMCLEVLGDCRKALAQFLPVAPVPSVAKPTGCATSWNKAAIVLACLFSHWLVVSSVRLPPPADEPVRRVP